MTDERWLPIPDFDGYEVSDIGRVRSYRRNPEGRLLRSHPLPHTGHFTVKLYADAVAVSARVHMLVMQAFVGAPPEGMEVCHNNGIPGDNRLENLRYASRSENIRDAVRHGTHNMTSKTHCKSGHPFDEANTIARSDGARDCRTCRYERTRASRVRLREKRSVA